MRQGKEMQEKPEEGAKPEVEWEAEWKKVTKMKPEGKLSGELREKT